jgi:hypothetical protein
LNYQPGSAEAFEAEWARCSAWLEAALDHALGAYGLTDVKARVMNRTARFWAGSGAAAVTVIERHANFPTLSIWLAGGDLEELRGEMLPQMEAYGREQGCRLVTIIGRKGWSRALDYKPLYHVCAKEL